MTKLLNMTFSHFFSKMVPLGINFALFYTRGKPLVQKSVKFMPTFKSGAKKSYLYFCHETVVLA